VKGEEFSIPLGELFVKEAWTANEITAFLW
jgi:hypothetical protein